MNFSAHHDHRISETPSLVSVQAEDATDCRPGAKPAAIVVCWQDAKSKEAEGGGGGD